ncbi:hypothetical protein K9M79_08770 [Candidatus Woesearchaeota archaeon]|nr:hypothetical protein [Candidatus Woesearchaeota archaeon]
MQVVEMMIFFIVSLFIGFMIINFVGNWDAEGAFRYFKDLQSGGGEQKFKTVDIDMFVSSSLRFWEDCGRGEVNMSLALYVDGSGNVNNTYVFDKIKEMNLCNTIQSATESCGTREDVDFSPTLIVLPSVVRIRCDPVSEKLVVRG